MSKGCEYKGEPDHAKVLAFLHSSSVGNPDDTQHRTSTLVEAILHPIKVFKIARGQTG